LHPKTPRRLTGRGARGLPLKSYKKGSISKFRHHDPIKCASPWLFVVIFSISPASVLISPSMVYFSPLVKHLPPLNKSFFAFIIVFIGLIFKC